METKASYQDMMELAKTLARSNLMPKELKGKPDDVFVVILQGSEMGLLPMQAVKMLSIISGKLSMSADGLAALVLRSPECAEFRMLKYADDECTYSCRRRDQTEPTIMSFTMADAKKAGLSGSNMYTKFPKAMLRARCISAAAKAVFPDLTAGFYDSDTGELTEGRGGKLEQLALADEVSGPTTETPAKLDPETVAALESAQREEKSGIHRALELVVSNGKKSEETGPKAPFSDDAPLNQMEQLRHDIESCESLEQLMELVPRIKEQSETVKKALGPSYAAKRAALATVDSHE
jgi:hypothetical protein